MQLIPDKRNLWEQKLNKLVIHTPVEHSLTQHLECKSILILNDVLDHGGQRKPFVQLGSNTRNLYCDEQFLTRKSNSLTSLLWS